MDRFRLKVVRVASLRRRVWRLKVLATLGRSGFADRRGALGTRLDWDSVADVASQLVTGAVKRARCVGLKGVQHFGQDLSGEY